MNFRAVGAFAIIVPTAHIVGIKRQEKQKCFVILARSADGMTEMKNTRACGNRGAKST